MGEGGREGGRSGGDCHSARSCLSREYRKERQAADNRCNVALIRACDISMCHLSLTHSPDPRMTKLGGYWGRYRGVNKQGILYIAVLLSYFFFDKLNWCFVRVFEKLYIFYPVEGIVTAVYVQHLRKWSFKIVFLFVYNFNIIEVYFFRLFFSHVPLKPNCLSIFLRPWCVHRYVV